MDVIRERITVKDSTVYDVEEPTIILAQTNPPVLKSMLHKEVIVTYLTDTVRYGFTAELVEFIDYRLDSGQVEALVVKRTGPEKPYSVRMSYRVGPTGQSNLSMSVFANKVDIIDISLGGTKFAYGMPFLSSLTISPYRSRDRRKGPHPRGTHPEDVAGRPRRRQRRPLVCVGGIRQHGEHDDRIHPVTQIRSIERESRQNVT